MSDHQVCFSWYYSLFGNIDKLSINEVEDDLQYLPSPEDLKGKILIKVTIIRMKLYTANKNI